jgi:P2-related tail formation protein
MSTTLRTAKLIELCTPSINYDAQVQAASEAFDQQMYEIIDETGQVIMIPSIMGINDPTLIDILAWQFHVDFYDEAASKPLEFRKNLVQMSIQWHMTKGTPALVQWVLDTYWPGGASIAEWYTYYNPLPPPLSPTVPPAIPYPALQSPPIVPPVGPSWHDRYRFRVYIDNRIIDPNDEQQVLKLIEHYKPISRWCEGIFRPSVVSDCNIIWAGAALRFMVLISDSPDYIIEAHGFEMDGPATAIPSQPSQSFTVQLRTGAILIGSAVKPVIVTPSDNGAGGTFEPPSVSLATTDRSATFAYIPAMEGDVTITVTNDGGLENPPPIVLTSSTPTYSMTGPTSGGVGADSTPFTVQLD